MTPSVAIIWELFIPFFTMLLFHFFSLSLDDCDVDDDDKDDLDDSISQSLKDRPFDPQKPSWHSQQTERT